MEGSWEIPFGPECRSEPSAINHQIAGTP
jgi:hypothetical protein